MTHHVSQPVKIGDHRRTWTSAGPQVLLRPGLVGGESGIGWVDHGNHRPKAARTVPAPMHMSVTL
jgi:hypothetical protein